MSQRHVWMRFNHDLIYIGTIRDGLPQGSVLSPLLFNVYMADFFRLRTEVKIIFFADDVTR